MAAARRGLAKSLPPDRGQPVRLWQDQSLAGRAAAHCRRPGGACLAAADLAPEPVTLVGHSLGAAVAFEAAARAGTFGLLAATVGNRASAVV